MCPYADPVAKVTILPAGLALGVTEQLPEAERHLYSEAYLTELLAVLLRDQETLDGATVLQVLAETSPTGRINATIGLDARTAPSSAANGFDIRDGPAPAVTCPPS